VPVSTTARTVVSAAAAWTASRRATFAATVMLFIDCGRDSVTVATAPRTSYLTGASMCWLIGVLS
jgi:hypothetical protein